MATVLPNAIIPSVHLSCVGVFYSSARTSLLPRQVDENHDDGELSMAFKPTRAEIAERNSIVQRLEEHAERLRSAIDAANDAANDAIEQAVMAVNTEIEAYNEVLAEGRQLASTIAQEAQDEISEKSEKWQQSGRGEAATEWASEWEDVDLSDVELASVDPIEEPELDHATTMADLPESVARREDAG